MKSPNTDANEERLYRDVRRWSDGAQIMYPVKKMLVWFDNWNLTIAMPLAYLRSRELIAVTIYDIVQPDWRARLAWEIRRLRRERRARIGSK